MANRLDELQELREAASLLYGALSQVSAYAQGINARLGIIGKPAYYAKPLLDAIAEQQARTQALLDKIAAVTGTLTL